jgi:hypothetical protein
VVRHERLLLAHRVGSLLVLLGLTLALVSERRRGPALGPRGAAPAEGRS